MSAIIEAIPVVRDSTVAILGVHMVHPQGVVKGKPRPAEFRCSFGSAFCVVAGRYLITAHHVIRPTGVRDEEDRFYALTVPGNGGPAYHAPVVGVPLERPELDLAVLEIGDFSDPHIRLPALPVCFDARPDGTPVVTVGFPAPEITRINLDARGAYGGGQFFLKSHANEGIVAAQYDLAGNPFYELNVGWHHGESGGPVAVGSARPAVFSVMQHYRDVQSPHGVVAGPHRGIALSCIRDELTRIGVVSE